MYNLTTLWGVLTTLKGGDYLKFLYVLSKVTALPFIILGSISFFDSFSYLTDIIKILLIAIIALIVCIIYLFRICYKLSNYEKTNSDLKQKNIKLNQIIKIKNISIEQKDIEIKNISNQYNDKIQYITSLLINASKETSAKDRRKLFDIYHTILEYIHK